MPPSAGSYPSHTQKAVTLPQGSCMLPISLLLCSPVLQDCTRAAQPCRHCACWQPRPCPWFRTHLSFSSCDTGSPTLSGRSRLLLYRPDCDSSFSCRAVIFLYLELLCCCWGGVLALGCLPPLQMSLLAKTPGEKRLGVCTPALPEPRTSAGRQPPLASCSS